MKRPSRIIVVGTSAGGLEALQVLVRGLPADFPAALLAVLHIPAHAPSLLGPILSRCGPLLAVEAVDCLPIEAGHIYVGMPDRHLLVDGSVMRLSRGPKENRFRPAIDALFRSAAYTQGRRVVGVVLTGQLDDGTSGLWAIKDRGGVAIVQSPRDAQYPSMPMSALQHVDADHVVDVAALPELLIQLSRMEIVEPLPEITSMSLETHAGVGDRLQDHANALDHPSRFTCPECHRVLGMIREGEIVRFRCHTGHTFSMQTLGAEVDESIDTGLWNVLRTLQERSMLLREAAVLARQTNNAAQAELLEARAMECEHRSGVIRALLQVPKQASAPQAARTAELDL